VGAASGGRGVGRADRIGAPVASGGLKTKFRTNIAAVQTIWATPIDCGIMPLDAPWNRRTADTSDEG